MCPFRSRFRVEPSYAPVENLVFGRMAFKGMNPEVELMMEQEDERRREAEASSAGQIEADVGDKALAEHFAGVRASIGRKFATKREHAAKRDASDMLAGPSTSSAGASGSQHHSGEELMARGADMVGQMRSQNRTWHREGSRGGHRGRGDTREGKGGKKRRGFLKPKE